MKRSRINKKNVLLFDTWFIILEYCNWFDIINSIQRCFRDVWVIINKHPNILGKRYKEIMENVPCRFLTNNIEKIQKDMKFIPVFHDTTPQHFWENSLFFYARQKKIFFELNENKSIKCGRYNYNASNPNIPYWFMFCVVFEYDVTFKIFVSKIVEYINKGYLPISNINIRKFSTKISLYSDSFFHFGKWLKYIDSSEGLYNCIQKKCENILITNSN